MTDQADIVEVDFVQPSISLYAPDWHGDAACAGDREPRPWDYTEQFFEDEVTSRDFRSFPEPLQDTMAICFECPVRRECITEAYAQELHIDDSNKLKPRMVEDSTRFGVWGGIPGRVRARFANHPDRLDAAEEWFQEAASVLRFGFPALLDDLFTAARQGADESLLSGRG